MKQKNQMWLWLPEGMEEEDKMSDKFVELMKETFSGNPKEDAKIIDKYAQDEISHNLLLEKKISLRRELGTAQANNDTEQSNKLERELSEVIAQMEMLQ